MYSVPTERFRHDTEEKKSRFITFVDRISDEAEFKVFLNEIRGQFPDARHWCYGFRIGPASHAHRGFSDDGEPSGTAGMPILNVLDHSGFSDTAVIVVRYFGGIKLGTGGLVRAYGGAAAEALKLAPKETYKAMRTISLNCDFSEENQLRYLIGKAGGNVISADYGAGVTLTASVSEDKADDLLAMEKTQED